MIGAAVFNGVGNSSVPAGTPVASVVKKAGVYPSEAIANLPQSAQTCLQFVVSGQPQNAQFSIASLVENDVTGLGSWSGSTSFPGTIRVSPAPHGASTIGWTVPAGGKKTEKFVFRISANGNDLWPENGGADSIMP
jgi:hypothetical protein